MTDLKGKINSEGVSALLVPCSARKRKLFRSLRAAALPRGTQDNVAQEWLRRLVGVPNDALVRADRLYTGRTHHLVRRLAAEFPCDYFIASAGLGLVRASTLVPGYDLTLSAKAAQSLRTRIRPHLDDARWWDQMRSGRFASSIDELAVGNARILVALTRPYAALIGRALSYLQPSARERLRIFGVGIVDPHLPEELLSQLIRYDARIDGLIAGTKHDASVRALVHFARSVAKSPLQSASADQQLVDGLLRNVKVLPRSPERERVSDAVIRRRIRLYVRKGTSVSAALRHLRAHAGIACEQHRFKRLYLEMNS